MRYLSVCSGIEAASCAWEGLGWELAGLAEIDPFASAVLEERYPGKNLGDFTKIDARSLGRIDLLVGGTPCQDFSTAGKRTGLEGSNGCLTLAFTDLVDELERHCGLRYVVWENVPAILSSKGNPFGAFLGRLLGADEALRRPTRKGWWPRAGVAAGPGRSASWRVLDAQFFGTPQRRERVFVVVGVGAGARSVGDILLEPRRDRVLVETTRERRRRHLVRLHSAGPVAPLEDGSIDLGPGESLSHRRPPAWAFNAAGNVSHVAHAILANDGSKTDLGVIQDSFPRKYYAVERERLQGFPDGWTDIEFRGERASHDLRTHAVGNAMPVTVMRWIGRRIADAERARDGRGLGVLGSGTPAADARSTAALDVLVPPRVRNLMEAMLLRPSREFTLAELFTLAGEGRGQTQVVVARLLQAGLLVERRTPSRRYLRADETHPIVADLRTLLLKARCEAGTCPCFTGEEPACRDGSRGLAAPVAA